MRPHPGHPTPGPDSGPRFVRVCGYPRCEVTPPEGSGYCSEQCERTHSAEIAARHGEPRSSPLPPPFEAEVEEART